MTHNDQAKNKKDIKQIHPTIQNTFKNKPYPRQVTIPYIGPSPSVSIQETVLYYNKPYFKKQFLKIHLKREIEQKIFFKQ